MSFSDAWQLREEKKHARRKREREEKKLDMDGETDEKIT